MTVNISKTISACVIVAILVSIIHIEATISPREKGKQKPNVFFPKSGAQDKTVFDRDLVVDEPFAKDIIVENGAYFENVSVRRCNGTILGYVTAWNNHGYDVAKIFGKKFDIISPVWLQIVRKKDEENYVLEGVHDIDAGWMKDVRRAGKLDKKMLKIFPRVIFERFTEKEIVKVLTNEKERLKVYDIIVKSCKQHKFDGIVLEIWTQLASRIQKNVLSNFVINMAKEFEKEGLSLVLVIPPHRSEMPDLFNEKDMDNLYKYVYAFSLTTYDFSTLQRPGANAPLYWMKQSIEKIVPVDSFDFGVKRKKILMGLNMYGNDFTPDGGEPITSHKYLDLVKHVKKRLMLDERNQENFFEIKTETGRHFVFYPTLYSINERIKLADEMGVGISIWELGQGLDYFYDLF